MILDDSWVELGDSVSVLVQRQGTKPVSLCYAVSLSTPTTEECFSLGEVPAMVFPAVTGKALFARSVSGGAITFEVL